MANQSIDNIRDVINAVPKLYEWEMLFDNMPAVVSAILPSSILTVLTDSAKLPGTKLNTAIANYKGAKFTYGTRQDRSGTVTLSLKEIRAFAGANDKTDSYLVRKAMLAWMNSADTMQGIKVTIPTYKINTRLEMQDEVGDLLYGVYYKGMFPTAVGDINLVSTSGEGAGYPVVDITFSYDWWIDNTETGYPRGG